MSDRPRDESGPDWYQSPARKRIHDEPAEIEPIFHAVSVAKLTVLSLATWGVYPMYWFFRNWQYQAARAGRSRYLGPLVCTLFADVLAYWLFREIRSYSEQTNKRPLPAGWLALAWALSFVPYVLPRPFRYLSLLGFVPLLPVQAAVNEINAKLRPSAPRNARFRPWEALLYGIALTLLAGGLLELLLHPEILDSAGRAR